MANLVLSSDKASSSHSAQDAEQETFEGNILKNVIRETWKEGVTAPREKAAGKSKGKNSEAVFDLDEHAMAMRKILSSYDYEISSMPVVVANAAHMSEADRRLYLAHLEAIAIGSTHIFGPEFTNAIMIGIPKKAKDHNAASRYTSLLLKMLERRQSVYKSRISKEGAAIQNASALILRHGSSVFRIFKRGKITQLKRVVERRSASIRRLESKADRYSYLYQKVKDKSKG